MVLEDDFKVYYDKIVKKRARRVILAVTKLTVYRQLSVLTRSTAEGRFEVFAWRTFQINFFNFFRFQV